jgi:hypothetical protein
MRCYRGGTFQHHIWRRLPRRPVTGSAPWPVRVAPVQATISRMLCRALCDLGKRSVRWISVVSDLKEKVHSAIDVRRGQTVTSVPRLCSSCVRTFWRLRRGRADGSRQGKTSAGRRCSIKPIDGVVQPRTATIDICIFNQRDREPNQMQRVDRRGRDCHFHR